VGSIGTKTQKAAVALDMKLVRVETAKVVASKRATASTEDSSFSVGGFGGGPWAAPSAASAAPCPA
jgi:curli biogenesis system outer membrane secretion channel CsgG